MAKFKKKSPRRTHRWTKRFHRKRDRRISIIGTTGAIGSFFIPQGRAGAKSMGQWITEWLTGKVKFDFKEVPDFLMDGMGQYIGYNPSEKAGDHWGIPWATVTIIGTSIAANIANKYGGKHLRNVPLVGKYVKF